MAVLDGHGAGGDASSPQSRDRHERSALWFSRKRRSGSILLHHRHIRPVRVREWSSEMDGIAATIWASQTTLDLQHRARSRPEDTHPPPHRPEPRLIPAGEPAHALLPS